MTTNSGNLTLSEKRELERLLKCEREHKRQKIVMVLMDKRMIIEKPYENEISALEAKQIEAVKAAGYSKIRERGCFDTHPEIDAFDAETNTLLKALWERSS